MKLSYLLLLIPCFVWAQKDPCKLVKTMSKSSEKVDFEFTYTYNSKGDLSNKKEFRSLSDGSYVQERDFEYNEKGYVSKITNKLNGQFRTAVFKEYNNLGVLVSEVESREESQSDLPINKVSTLGNSREKLYYENDGSVGSREKEIKDSKGNILLKEIRGAENQLYHSYEKTYNAKGEVTYSKSIDVVGDVIEEHFYEFNAKNKVEKDSVTVNGTVNTSTLYEYNSSGYLVKKTLLNNRKEIEYVSVYKVDEQGRIMEESFIYKGDVINKKRNTYNGDKKVKEEQLNNQGSIVKVITWEYNCN
jgi:hypothetical protein